MNRHPSPRVDDAIVKLNDALCEWERATGRQSVLILREEGGWSHRSVNGKPVGADVAPDNTLLDMIRAEHRAQRRYSVRCSTL